MIMTDEEICRDYRTAKSPLKQIGILAQLNQCPKEKIKEILIAGGCELPGNMRPKPKGPRTAAKEPEPEKAEPETVPMSEVVAVRDALPLLVGESALKVIADLAEKFGDSEDDQFYFRHQVAGVMLLYREIERRCGE